jgi:hypothetical protein
MSSRFRLTLRQGAGTILMIVGVLFWVLTVVFPLTALHFRFLASLDHSDKLSLAVVAGGASLVGGTSSFLLPAGAPMKETASPAGAHEPYQRG